MRHVYDKDGNPNKLLAFDIETVREKNAQLYVDQYKKFEAPSNYKSEEAIERYIHNAKEKEIARAALYIPTQQVWVISAHDLTTGEVFVYDSKIEAETIRKFFDDLESRFSDHVLVGFNSDKFDVPALIGASLRTGIEIPKQIKNSYLHTDILQDFPNKIKLQDIAYLLGTSKLMEGGDVEQLWLRYTMEHDPKALDECIAYCIQDTDLVASYMTHVYGVNYE